MRSGVWIEKIEMILKHNCENMLLPGDLKISKFSFNEIFGNEKEKKRENPYIPVFNWTKLLKSDEACNVN